VVLGVTRGFAVELAKVADVVARHRGLSQSLVVGIHRLCLGKVEHRPEQHRGVTVREHEPIAVGPDRVLRVEAHDAVPDRVDQRGERHRRAGVPRLGLLDRVNRKRADGIDTQLINFHACHWLSNLRRTHGFLLANPLIFCFTAATAAAASWPVSFTIRNATEILRVERFDWCPRRSLISSGSSDATRIGIIKYFELHGGLSRWDQSDNPHIGAKTTHNRPMQDLPRQPAWATTRKSSWSVAVGLCQPPAGETLWSTSLGPQVPFSYS
jgi:hypothetical protein